MFHVQIHRGTQFTFRPVARYLAAQQQRFVSTSFILSYIFVLFFLFSVPFLHSLGGLAKPHSSDQRKTV